MLYSAINLRGALRPPKPHASSFFHLCVGYYNVVLPSFLIPNLTDSQTFWLRCQSTKLQTYKAVKSKFLVTRALAMSIMRQRQAVGWAIQDDAIAAHKKKLMLAQKQAQALANAEAQAAEDKANGLVVTSAPSPAAKPTNGAAAPKPAEAAPSMPKVARTFSGLGIQMDKVRPINGTPIVSSPAVPSTRPFFPPRPSTPGTANAIAKSPTAKAATPLAAPISLAQPIASPAPPAPAAAAAPAPTQAPAGSSAGPPPPPPGARPTQAPQAALMGVSFLGNLDAISNYTTYTGVHTSDLTFGARQRPGGMLMFAYTFAGRLWFSLGWDVNGYPEGVVENFWRDFNAGVGEFLNVK